MGFLSELYDNVVIVGAAALDATNPVNWVYGTAPLTAYVAETQTAERENRPVSEARITKSTTGGLSTLKEAASETADTVKAKVEEVAEQVKDSATFLGKHGGKIAIVVALVVVAVVALPYAAAAKELVK